MDSRVLTKPKSAMPPTVLTGADRVSALLLTLGQPMAGRLLKHFSADEVKQITKSASDLGGVSPDQIRAVVDEFAATVESGASLYGTAAAVEKLLTGVVPPEQLAPLMAEVFGNKTTSIWETTSIWDRVSGVSESILASYLVKEHPQTAALILSKVKPASAAKVLGHLPPAFRNGLMRRMLAFKPIVNETMRTIERTVHEDFMLNFSGNVGTDPHAKMADIINKMDREHMEDSLQSLSAVRPKSAEILRGLLFTFDDIVKLQTRTRTTLFDQVSSEKIVLALKGTDNTFRGIVLSSLASRVRRMVEHELSSGEPAAQRDVLEARRSITDLALSMAARGEIELNSDNESDAYIK